MNNRIKELVTFAGFDPEAIARMGVMPQAKKFAELIIADCLEEIRLVPYYHDKVSFGDEVPFQEAIHNRFKDEHDHN